MLVHQDMIQLWLQRLELEVWERQKHEAQELTDGEQFQLYMSFLFLQARYKEPNE